MRLMLLVGLLISAPASANCDDPFADPNEVLRFELELTRADWNTVRTARPVGTGCAAQYPMVPARFRCGESSEVLEIGVRRKRGDQNGQDTDQKPPIKLDFNEFVSGQRWPKAQKDLGYRKLSLNNGQQSRPGGLLPALLSEHVAWRVMKAAVPYSAAGVAYATLTIRISDENIDEYHGVYVLIEDIDKTAVRRRLGSTCGRLLKTTTVECPDEVEFDDGLPNQSAARYQKLLGGEGTAEDALMLDNLLTQEAVRDLLAGGYDTPLGPHWNNFVQFDPRGGKTTFFPWDLDVPFRPYPEDVAPELQLEPRCSTLGQKTRCDSRIHQRYVELACALTEGPLGSNHLLETWDEADRVVRPHIADEIDSVWSGRNPLDDKVTGSYASEYGRIRAWIPKRITDVRRQLKCPSICSNGNSRTCGEKSCAGTQVCEQGVWSPCAPTSVFAEVCNNGLDDDCNGSIDEGCNLSKEECPEGEANPTVVRPAAQCGGCSGAPGLTLLAVLAWLRRRLRDSHAASKRGPSASASNSGTTARSRAPSATPRHADPRAACAPSRARA